MSSKYEKLSFENIRTYSIKERFSKVQAEDFAKPSTARNSMQDFIDHLPGILIGKDFKEFVKHYRQAVDAKEQIIWMIGAHVIKCGLSPVLIDLMKKGYISHLAMNGAGAIHDTEVAV